MTKTILINNPEPSAKRLVSEANLPPALQSATAKVLARWLAENPDCLVREKGSPQDNWPVSARRAREAGQPVYRFRLRKAVSKEIRGDLRWLRLANRYVFKDNKGPSVRQAACKVRRSVVDQRASWAQVQAGLAQLRSLVQRSGREAKRVTPLCARQTIDAASGKSWKLITTVKELEDIGRANGLCTSPCHPGSKYYARGLKNGSLKFWKLLSESGQFLALISIRDGNVEEARGKGNKILGGYKVSLRMLLKDLGVSAGDAEDMIAAGVVDGFPAVNLNQTELEVASVRFWFAEDGSVLLHKRGDDENKHYWAVLRQPHPGVFLLKQPDDHFDAENLIGLLLAQIRDRLIS